MKIKIIFLFVLFEWISCDLTLFSSEHVDTVEKKDQFGDGFDRLYLFSNTKDCSEKLNEAEKKDLCSDFCIKLQQNISSEDIKGTQDVLPKVEIKSTQPDLNLLNLTGALNYYKNFVHSFITYLREQEPEDDLLEYKIGIELDKFQLDKLEKFSIANDSEAPKSVLDVTDILKGMFVKIETNKKPTIKEKVAEFLQFEFDPNVLQYAIIGIMIVVFSVSFYLYTLRFGLRITWRKVIGTLLFALFITSVINNHKYLSQKKQILNQQKLKDFVPDECLVQNENPHKNKNIYSRLFSVVKMQFGYTATSRRCLEYHEAMFITSTQNNYMETVVFTVSESVRPVATLFGDFINQFFSALTKDLSFYQYMPLIGLVTTVFVPIVFIIICFICLVLFGYEFNFLHLISFKRNQTTSKTSGLKQEDLLPILNLIKKETDKLPIKTLKPNESFPALESDNLSESLTQSLKNIFERMSDRANEFQTEIENLKKENQKLQAIEYNSNENQLEKSEIEEARCLSLEYTDHKNTSEKMDNSEHKATREVSIGLSKSIKRGSKTAKKNDNMNKSKNNQLTTGTQLPTNTDDDYDDEESIYVILDEN